MLRCRRQQLRRRSRHRCLTGVTTTRATATGAAPIYGSEHDDDDDDDHEDTDKKATTTTVTLVVTIARTTDTGRHIKVASRLSQSP
jgi:hypothetical protein